MGRLRFPAGVTENAISPADAPGQAVGPGRSAAGWRSRWRRTPRPRSSASLGSTPPPSRPVRRESSSFISPVLHLRGSPLPVLELEDRPVESNVQLSRLCPGGGCRGHPEGSCGGPAPGRLRPARTRTRRSPGRSPASLAGRTRPRAGKDAGERQQPPPGPAVPARLGRDVVHLQLQVAGAPGRGVLVGQVRAAAPRTAGSAVAHWGVGVRLQSRPSPRTPLHSAEAGFSRTPNPRSSPRPHPPCASPRRRPPPPRGRF